MGNALGLQGSVTTDSTVVGLDVRGLEPPQPMVRILQALETLSPGEILEARTDRVPAFLLARLDEEGISYSSQRGSDGSHITRIHKD